MVAMGRNLGHKIVAEGVENTEQLKMVRALGCDTAQGYYFSKPVGQDAMAALLASRHWLEAPSVETIPVTTSTSPVIE